MPGKTWPCLQTPGGCSCKCHAISQGRRNGSRKPGARDWTAQERVTLHALVKSGEPAEVIAQELERKYGHPRTRGAVIRKAVQLGLLVKQGWYTGAEVRAGLGVHSSRVTDWISARQLKAQRHVGVIRGTQSQWWHIEGKAVLEFIDKHAGLLFKVRTVKHPDWRRRAEVAARANTRRVTP
jgi:hypothetical protein